MDSVRQHDSRPFYEIADEAYMESKKDGNDLDPSTINYWVFQGNPAQFRIVKSLEDSALRTWRVTARAKRLSGRQSSLLGYGCSKLVVTRWQRSGPVCLPDPTTRVNKYYQLTGFAGQSTQRVNIKILLNLWDRPSGRKHANLPAFSEFKGGNQGTNFTATQAQYEMIEKLSKTGDVATGSIPLVEKSPVEG